jgi:hypothetical protein
MNMKESSGKTALEKSSFHVMIAPLRHPCPHGAPGRIAMVRHYLNGKFLP